jgi:hypothetical protein
MHTIFILILLLLLLLLYAKEEMYGLIAHIIS